MSDGLPQLRRVGMPEVREIVRRHEAFRVGRMGGARANLGHCDLSGMSLVKIRLVEASAPGIVFRRADLTGAELDQADLFGADFREATLCGASLERADLRGATFQGADLTGAKLCGADFRDGAVHDRLKAGVLVRRVHRDDGFHLGGARLVRSDLSGARMGGIAAACADFSDAVLVGTKFEGATLRGSCFRGATLDGVDLSGADLRDADFTDAVMNRVVLTGASLEGMIRKGVVSDTSMGVSLAELRGGLALALSAHAAWVGSSGVEGRRLCVSGYDLRGTVSLEGALCTLAVAERAVFFGLSLVGLQGQAGEFRGADFREVVLNSADLRGSDLRECRFHRAHLSGVDFGPLDLGNGRSKVTRLEKAVLRQVDLRGANLRGAVLDGADLTGARLEGADLTGASVVGACFENVDGPRHLAVNGGARVRAARVRVTGEPARAV